jgi:molecular chaperone DnaK
MYDFGIDLGTTNSAIAMLKGQRVEVFKNGIFEVTPSAVSILANGRVRVGHNALPSVERSGFADTKIEFKRQMGQDIQLEFEQAGVSKSPEELSAEVLMELRRTAEERGEEVRYAVITVPAMFELSQKGATERAAQLAGFEHAILLQEPIAAAIGYGYEKDIGDEFWLVYDLGGGTFDTSLLSTRDGQLTVIDNAGDNFLGGTNFDKSIVNHLLIPHLEAQHNLSLSSLGDGEHETVLARLKVLAENAKIELSRQETAIIEDPEGLIFGFDFELEITRQDFIRLIDEKINNTLKICRGLISDNNLKPADITKIILVGGPTNAPFIRERISELGIPIEVGIDPMTVVAQGAAIYASTQKLPSDVIQQSQKTGEFFIDLDFHSITQDETPLVGGKISRVGDTSCPEGLRIQIRRDDGGWVSALILVDASGMFMSDVAVTPNQNNEFHITVQDASGATVNVSPASFSIIHGGVRPPDSVPLSRSIRIARADGSTEVMIEKGTPLPCTSRAVRFRTTKELRPGVDDELVVSYVEGEQEKADRNLYGGKMTIKATDVTRLLPADSVLEVIISVDDNAKVSEMSVFVEPLDQEFNEFEPVKSEFEPAEIMRRRIEAERQRLERILGQARELGDEIRNSELQKIKDGNQLSELDSLMDAQERGDHDAPGHSRNLLVALKNEIDKHEAAIELPRLKEEYENSRQQARKMVQDYSVDDDGKRLVELEREADQAIAEGDTGVLAARISDIDDLIWHIWCRQPEFWVWHFQELAKPENQRLMNDQDRAMQLYAEGKRAVSREDNSSLQSVVQDLWGLMPAEEAAAARLQPIQSHVR